MSMHFMCGIVCLFGEKRNVPRYLLTHRGPDDFKSVTLGKCQIDYYRLAINDLTSSGMQPFEYKGLNMFACNGEIYNYKDLQVGEETSSSDCEPVMHVIRLLGVKNALEMVRGDFAFVYTDGDHVIAARDPVGVRPLFYTRYADGSIAFASEAKALLFLETPITVFPPGHFYDSTMDDFVCYYTGHWRINTTETISRALDVQKVFENAVKIRLDMSDRPKGFLLSGGLDSSLVCAIAQRMSSRPIRTFSIGLEGSPDLEAARVVADYIGSNHTEITYTIEEGLEAVPEVIRSIESWDTTTVRASVPNFLLCKYISENTDVRYIFSGEGSDEILGGYYYFKYAPNVNDFALENMRRLRLIHQFDGLRADRCAARFGLDLVVPFLDRDFIELCMTMNQKTKVTILEKEVLRKAFHGYLPDIILYRNKAAFSDAVGEAWVRRLRDLGDNISDTMMDNIRLMCRGQNEPRTKEEAYYRDIFWSFYGSVNDSLIREYWRPRWTHQTDPSARLLIENDLMTCKE
ncbi:hypothetical protein DSLPV1_181 [Dishui lake phycodnavirus 1]|uniref:hypothetical protein n=1 Tax=Dishui lake phycodnavirus 1 TaxID=2079134 RepID=UPI000CD6BADC|nr:hypothetical protein C5Y57_gp217 [Dishui lake phycodnavirus 1]AUT19152.1 hypothetical protein DSLPV1_181 [Dishui lake phycodnavirus 1]